MSRMKDLAIDELNSIPRCPECKSESVYFTNDALYCQNCGYVDELEKLIMEEE